MLHYTKDDILGTPYIYFRQLGRDDVVSIYCLILSLYLFMLLISSLRESLLQLESSKLNLGVEGTVMMSMDSLQKQSLWRKPWPCLQSEHFKKKV